MTHSNTPEQSDCETVSKALDIVAAFIWHWTIELPSQPGSPKPLGELERNRARAILEELKRHGFAALHEGPRSKPWEFGPAPIGLSHEGPRRMTREEDALLKIWDTPAIARLFYMEETFTALRALRPYEDTP